MKKLLLTLMCVVAGATASRAATVLSDTFTYPDGNLVGASGSPWLNHSGTTPITVTNGVVRVTGGNSEDANAPLAGAPYLDTDPSAVLYSGFTIVVSNLPGATGAYFAHFRGTNSGAATDFGARVWISTTNAIVGGLVPAGKFRLGIGNGTLVSAATGQINQDLDTNVTYTVVTRFQPSNGTNSQIWLNPTLESDPSVTATDPGTLARPNSFNVFTYAFRQASGEGTIYIDNLKVGTTFGDATGQSPSISSIPNQAIAANGTTGPIPFTISDDQSPASSLVLSSNSSNTLLVPLANISFGGANGNRTVTVTPAAGQQGTATITVTVSDGVNTAFTTFIVTVGVPTISTIPNQITQVDVPIVAIPFTISDPEGDPLTLSSNSSNPTLISNISFGGSGANRTVTLTPELGQSGVAVITVTVSDGVRTASQNFTVSVSPVLGLIFQDDFTYLDGSLVGAGGFWSTHSGTALQLQVTNGMAMLVRTNTEDVNTFTGFGGGAPFAQTSGVVLYSGFTISAVELPNSAGNYFAHFKDNTTSGFRARVFASTNTAAPGHYRIGIANQGSTASAQVANDLALNTTYLVVSRYNVGTGESVVWVNPQPALGSAAVPTDSISTMTVHQYALRQDTGMGTIFLDNLKIGTSLADVATIPALSQTLTSQVIGGELVLSWGAPLFALQSASVVTGPYTTIPGATSPYTNAPTASQQYFRLKY